MDESAMVGSEALKAHVSSHVMYPATKAQIMQSCHTGELPDDVHKMAEAHLEDKTYQSADEVLKALHMA